MQQIILIIISLVFSSCFLSANTPDPNIWRQDDLYCWKYYKGHGWKEIGTNDKCPEGTEYRSIFDE